MEPLATARARDIIGTTVDVIDQERPPQALFMEVSPAAKQISRMLSNIGEGTGNVQLQQITDEALRQRNPES